MRTQSFDQAFAIFSTIATKQLECPIVRSSKVLDKAWQRAAIAPASTAKVVFVAPVQVHVWAHTTYEGNSKFQQNQR